MTTTERRRSVRTAAKLAMEVKLSGGGSGRAETINVSANGVYFTSPAYIAPLTRVEITLLLPDPSSGRSERTRRVACEGVVVRTEPAAPKDGLNHYDIACFFTSIDEDDRSQLASYILKQLPF